MEDGEIIMTMPLTEQPKMRSLTADLDDLDDLLGLTARLKEAGTFIPKELQTKEGMTKALEDERITRYTMMGKTIGLQLGDQILMEGKDTKI